MARRLSVQEEQEIVGFMRDHPGASVRSVAHRFGRSRPTISDLRSRYALDRPQAPASSGEAGARSSDAEASFDYEAAMAWADANAKAQWEAEQRGEDTILWHWNFDNPKP